MPRRSDLLLAALLLIFLLVQLYAGLVNGVQTSSDTAVFADMARRHPLLSEGFLAGPRPPLTSLLLKAVAGSPRWFVAVQWLVHICAWASLAVYFRVRFRGRPAGLLLAAWVLALAVLPHVQIWNFYLLSESLSISCLPLIFLLSAHANASRRVGGWLGLSAVLLAATFVRDVGAYMALALGASLCVVGFRASGLQGFRAGPLLLLVTVAAGFVISSMTASIGGPGPMDKRWVFPLGNVLGQRVLPDGERRHFFETRGMPASDAVLGQAHKWASTDTFRLYRDPALADLRQWLTSRGKTTYLEYLVLHPKFTIGSVVQNRAVILHQTRYGLEGYYPDGYYGSMEPVFALEARLLWVALPAVVAVVHGAWKRRSGWRSGDRRRLSLLAALAVPIPVLMVVSYHGDAMELARHSVPAAVYVRLYLVFAAFLLLDADEGDQARAPIAAPGAGEA